MKPRRRTWSSWGVAAALLVIGLTAWTRATAPWRIGVVIDEMHHLESWRNRYGTDDIYPLFSERLETGGWLTDGQLDLFHRVYDGSRLFQRGLLVLVDPQPPLYPVLAETIAAVSDSNLIAARIPSAIASALTVLLMYLLGRALLDRTLGLWLASLVAIGMVAQFYAGVARPYAMAQMAVVLAILVFVREQKKPSRSPWRLWLSALLAQSLQWICWPVVGPLVLIELVRRRRAGARVTTLIRHTWWYALASVLLLPIMAVQLINPTISEQSVILEPTVIWYHFCVASPFAEVDALLGLARDFVFSPAALGLALLVFTGAACVIGDPDFLRGRRVPGPIANGETATADPTIAAVGLSLPTVRAAVLACAAVSLIAPIVIGSAWRFMMSYSVPFLVLAAVGANWLLRTERAAQITLVAMLAAFSMIAASGRQDPHDRLLLNETDFALVAERLLAELEPGDTWTAHPYFFANCLYTYGELEEPITHIDDDAFWDYITGLDRSAGNVFVFARGSMADLHITLRRADRRWEFKNDFVLIELAERRLR